MTAQFKIEKGVPLPTGRGKYPFGYMDVGDSFVAGEYSRSFQSRLSSLAVSYGQTHDIKFSCRKDTDGNLRVWSVA